MRLPLVILGLLPLLLAPWAPAAEPPAATVQRLPIPEGRIRDRAWYALEAGGDQGVAKPLALVLHDAREDGALALERARGLLAAGWVVCAPNAMGAAGWTMEDLGLAARALDLARRVHAVDCRRLVLVGTGAGANAAAALARLDPSPWCGLALIGTRVEAPAMPALLQAADGTGLAAWAAALPALAGEPALRLDPPAGRRPWWRRVRDPVGFADRDDPAVVHLDAGREREALALLDRRIAGGGGDRFAHLLRAAAVLPGLRDPLPTRPGADAFPAARGWGDERERRALRDLRACIDADPQAPPQALATAYALASRIWARRALDGLPAGAAEWVPSYQRFRTYVLAANRLDPTNPEPQLLSGLVLARLPTSF
jgi:hypothetical protein